jgi:6-phosphogluconolactonase (cycloisomerase 2 family)
MGLKRALGFLKWSISGGLLVMLLSILQGCPSGNSNSNNEFLYISNQSDNTITGFSINSTSGVLSSLPGSPFSSGGTTPFSIAITPNGKWAYVANQNSGTISIFSINPASGTLTPLTNSTSLSGANLVNIRIDPTGYYLYALSQGNGSSNSNSLYGYTLNPSTGELTSLTGSPFMIASAGQATAMAIDPSNRFIHVAISNSSNSYDDVITLNSNTGIPSDSGTIYLQGGSNPTSIVTNSAGSLVFLSNASGYISVSSVNNTSGALTAVSGSPFATTGVSGPVGLAINSANNFLFLANQNSSNVQAYSVNTGTGYLTSAGTPVAAGSLPSAIAIEPNGNFLFVGNGGNATVTTFSISSAGLLNQTGNYTTGRGPSSMATTKPAQN